MNSFISGQGTLANVCAIIIGGIIGYFFGQKLKYSLQETLLKINGVALIFYGFMGYSEKAFRIHEGQLTGHGFLFCIIALSLGSVIGEYLDIEKAFLRFAEWLKKKTGSQADSRFLPAFLETSFTVCVGAMAIIGSLEDGIHHQPQILYSKAIIDAVIVMMMAASLGKGAIFSFIPVAVWQGLITLFGIAVSAGISAPAMDNLSLVGNLLIACVGINLSFGKKIRVANTLPSLFIAYLISFF